MEGETTWGTMVVIDFDFKNAFEASTHRRLMQKMTSSGCACFFVMDGDLP